MGAYYEYQVFRDNGGHKGAELVLPLSGYAFRAVKDNMIGFKFLEHCYQFNLVYQTLLDFLKRESSPNCRYIVNTVCDYDEQEAFENMHKEFGDSLLFRQRVVNRGQRVVNRLTNNENHKLKENFAAVEKFIEKYNMDCAVKNGFIVNPERREFFDISYFSKTPEKYVVAPIALLTRSQYKSQGGGDLYQGNIDRNENFDESLIAAWKDHEIYYVEKLSEDEKEFSDISPELLMVEDF